MTEKEEFFLEEDEDNMSFVEEGEEEESWTQQDDELLLDPDNLHSSSRLLRKSSSFEVLTSTDIEEETKKTITDLSELLGLTPSTIITLLIRYKWNKENVITALLENREQILKQYGLEENQPKTDLIKKKLSCGICLEEGNTQTLSLKCGHQFCHNCWRSYLDFKIKEGKSCLYATCMATDCKTLVTEDYYKKLVSAPRFKQYKFFVLQSFTNDNPLVKWCPAPNCSNCIRCERLNRTSPVKCSCGFIFCFRCSDYLIGDHAPSTCEQIEKWNSRAADESENVKWMIANTKKCPQCRSPIEKNGGCMHLTCRKESGGCGHEFCWLCRGPWKEHGSHTGGYYNCNKYEDSKEKKKDATQRQDIKTELEVYMFYFHRFDSHKNAMKIADQQRKTTEQKGIQIQKKFDVRSQDTKFLLEATEQLLINRRVLQFSYVFGFYLDKKKLAEKNLFEYLQEELEKHTNFLSELYETPLEKLQNYQEFWKWKEDVSNYTRVTSKFLENFVNGIRNGLTNNST